MPQILPQITRAELPRVDIETPLSTDADRYGGPAVWRRSQRSGVVRKQRSHGSGGDNKRYTPQIKTNSAPATIPNSNNMMSRASKGEGD